ncbi:uncharacterized protein LOC141874285 isoform X2 [Acropora palmata]|uniref:uncharacterized protein LOC141874285 isoform X2 n=1 Tax=Acropora palmata TaxID=6131 RepID=UPI003DA0920B
MAACKFETKGKQQYRQKGSKEGFLRSVSYHEFTRLVYGRTGNTRIPLPACAYSVIRKQFPINKDENYVGFELDDD